MIIGGVSEFQTQGKIEKNREDVPLIGIEKTSTLVNTGIYHYIRHPFYSSLLFLGWGIFLKNLTWLGLLLALMNTILLCITARREETENIDFLGESYQFFMQETKMFIPFLF
jgi:protein-S-isoprenylcysteine O-methyltransferase Ste14